MLEEMVGQSWEYFMSHRILSPRNWCGAFQEQLYAQNMCVTERAEEEMNRTSQGGFISSWKANLACTDKVGRVASPGYMV